MNAEQFFKRLGELGDLIRTTTEKVNTCNAWGFDGWFGTRHNFIFNGNSYELRDGKVGTRHRGTFRLFGVFAYEPKFIRQDAKPFLDDVAKEKAKR